MVCPCLGLALCVMALAASVRSHLMRKQAARLAPAHALQEEPPAEARRGAVQGQGREFMQWLQHTQLTSLALTLDAQALAEPARCAGPCLRACSALVRLHARCGHFAAAYTLCSPQSGCWTAEPALPWWRRLDQSSCALGMLSRGSCSTEEPTLGSALHAQTGLRQLDVCLQRGRASSAAPAWPALAARLTQLRLTCADKGLTNAGAAAQPAGPRLACLRGHQLRAKGSGTGSLTRAGSCLSGLAAGRTLLLHCPLLAGMLAVWAHAASVGPLPALHAGGSVPSQAQPSRTGLRPPSGRESVSDLPQPQMWRRSRSSQACRPWRCQTPATGPGRGSRCWRTRWTRPPCCTCASWQACPSTPLTDPGAHRQLALRASGGG